VISLWPKNRLIRIRQRYTQGKVGDVVVRFTLVQVVCQAHSDRAFQCVTLDPGRHCKSSLPYPHSTLHKMAELSLEDKCKAAAKLIEQSPPGEVK
jgi:hypothetical protein